MTKGADLVSPYMRLTPIQRAFYDGYDQGYAAHSEAELLRRQRAPLWMRALLWFLDA